MRFLISFNPITSSVVKTRPHKKLTGFEANEKGCKMSSWIVFCLHKTVQCENQIIICECLCWSLIVTWCPKVRSIWFSRKTCTSVVSCNQYIVANVVGAEIASTSSAPLFWRHFKATSNEIKHVLPYTISNKHHANIPLQTPQIVHMRAWAFSHVLAWVWMTNSRGGSLWKMRAFSAVNFDLEKQWTKMRHLFCAQKGLDDHRVIHGFQDAQTWHMTTKFISICAVSSLQVWDMNRIYKSLRSSFGIWVLQSKSSLSTHVQP